jgi:predicted phosphodiesterase
MGVRKWVFISDSHGDLIDKRDEQAFLDFCSDYKPHDRIHGGDVWDFRNLRKGVDPEEELDDPEPDFIAGHLFLERFKPTVLCLGNHDHRLWRMVTSTRGIMRKYARDGIKQIEMGMKAMNCRILPYDIDDGEYQLGDDLSFTHGYSTNMSAVREHVTAYHGRKVVMGHVHRNEILATRTKGGVAGMSVGGIANHKQMNYARHRLATFMWGKGWAYGTWNTRTGKTTLFPMFKQGNLWLRPST